MVKSSKQIKNHFCQKTDNPGFSCPWLIWVMCRENVPPGENFRKPFFLFCVKLDLGNDKMQ